MTLKLSKTMLEMKVSKLSLQAMSRLCFLCRLREHILAHSNAPFVEKPRDWFLLIVCVEAVCGE